MLNTANLLISMNKCHCDLHGIKLKTYLKLEFFQVSGTAAKLGKDTAYHHCTVLVDVNECVLHDALNSQAVRFNKMLSHGLVSLTAVVSF